MKLSQASSKRRSKNPYRENVNANRQSNRKQHYKDRMKNKILSSGIKQQTDLNEWPWIWASNFREKKNFVMEHKAMNCFMKNQMFCGSV